MAHASWASIRTCTSEASAYLVTFVSASADQVVRTSLDRLRQPLVRNVQYLDRDRRPPRERLDGGAQALLGEHGRMEPTGELTELVERER